MHIDMPMTAIKDFGKFDEKDPFFKTLNEVYNNINWRRTSYNCYKNGNAGKNRSFRFKGSLYVTYNRFIDGNSKKEQNQDDEKEKIMRAKYELIAHKVIEAMHMKWNDLVDTAQNTTVQSGQEVSRL